MAVERDLPGHGQGQDTDRAQGNGPDTDEAQGNGPDTDEAQGNGPDTDEAQSNGKQEWKRHELKLRKREVRWGKYSVIAQALVAAVALGTVYAALEATQTAQESVNATREGIDATREGIERQAAENRLSTAIGAVGGDQAAERVGGFSLLRRHVNDQLSVANGDDGGDEALEAYSLYTIGLDVLENYLRSPPDHPTESNEVAPEGTPARRGYGIPVLPSDNDYAANQLQAMMDLKTDVQKLMTNLPKLGMKPGSPGVDLSKAQLYGKSWPGIDFAWLRGGHVFAGIDLRGANLQESIWGTIPDDPYDPDDPKQGSNLTGAFLQCANLVDAKLIGTTLKDADLSGANLSGADLTDADLDGVKLRGATWSNETKGLEGVPQTGRGKSGRDKSRGADGPKECLEYKPYWVRA